MVQRSFVVSFQGTRKQSWNIYSQERHKNKFEIVLQPYVNPLLWISKKVLDLFAESPVFWQTFNKKRIQYGIKSTDQGPEIPIATYKMKLLIKNVKARKFLPVRHVSAIKKIECQQKFRNRKLGFRTFQDYKKNRVSSLEIMFDCKKTLSLSLQYRSSKNWPIKITQSPKQPIKINQSQKQPIKISQSSLSNLNKSVA